MPTKTTSLKNVGLSSRNVVGLEVAPLCSRNPLSTLAAYRQGADSTP
jgi:hypothetical protein